MPEYTTAEPTNGFMLPLPKPGQRWWHFKGNTYLIIGCSQHTESGEDLVTYVDFITGQWYTRPLAAFLELVNDGQPRFTLLE